MALLTFHHFHKQFFLAWMKENHRLVGYGKQCSWYGHVSRREDGHVLRRALDCEVDGKRKNGEDMEEAG